MSTVFLYTSYELVIQSDIELPQLRNVSYTEDVDVVIQTCNDIKDLNAPTATFGLWQSTATEFLLDVPRVARFLVSQGRFISIAPDSSPPDVDQIRLHLLGSVFAALLQQRSQFALHASAVYSPKGATLFVGRSGAGKSTLATGLGQRGFPLICDDIAAIQCPEDATPHVLPAAPLTRIWRDSAEQLEIHVKAKQRVRQALEKYYTPSVAFQAKVAQIQHIVILGTTNISDYELHMLPQTTAMQYLHRFTYRKRYIADPMRRQAHFLWLSTIVKSVTSHQLKRPLHSVTIPQTLDFIMESKLI